MKFFTPLSASGVRTLELVLGTFLFFRFAGLLPDAALLFGGDGLITLPHLLPGFPFFPNPLQFVRAPAFAVGFVAGLGVLSLILISGRYRRPALLLLAWGSVCLIQRNPWIDQPALAWMHWLLLALALSEKNRPVPLSLSTGAWLLFSLATAYAGVQKLLSPSWADGTALTQLLFDPMARDSWLTPLLLGSPLPFLKVLTWIILGWQLLFLPLALFSKTRKLAWAGELLLCAGSLIFFRGVEASVGMALFVLFLTDETWFPARPSRVPAILYFDGICGLCNRFVDRALAEDRQAVLHFSPLQGETARKNLLPAQTTGLHTLVFTDEDGRFEKSEAVLRSLSRIGGIWRGAELLRLVPRFIRDLVYDLIARNRHAWFEKRESCRLPTPEEKPRFLP